MEFVWIQLLSSPLGTILTAATEAGLCMLRFLQPDAPEKDPESQGPVVLPASFLTNPRFIWDSNPVLERAQECISAYFDGTSIHLDVPVDFLTGTPFQKEVWRALREIPYGETRSYGQIAARIGRPKAARAVGRACGKNPVALVVPCHRVIASDGSLGGFSSGLAIKKALLEREGAFP